MKTIIGYSDGEPHFGPTRVGCTAVASSSCLFLCPVVQSGGQRQASRPEPGLRENKKALRALVIDPFKRVLYAVRDELPAPVREVMETEKYLFANIVKQFTNLGCWDYYWGAFYPKGGKRTQDAQLSMWMNFERLEFGFYIGEYGSEQRKRFERNCRLHGDVLLDYFQEVLPESEVSFGRPDNFVVQDGAIHAKVEYSWKEFLSDPAAAGNDVSVLMTWQEVLATPEQELVRRGAEVHAALFPLVLLATQDDPLPAIASYCDSPPPEDEEGEIEPPEPYDRETFLARTYLEPAQADELYDMLCDKRQIILYGPPGTGKTFVAQELARWVTGLADPSADRVEMIQFHPAYSYEDFL